MSRVNQPVLQLLPARARSVGPSAGLLEGPDGGVVFVFGAGHVQLRQRRPGRPAVGRGAAGHH